MILYYDRKGKPIPGSKDDPNGTLTWGRMFEDFDYHVLYQDYTAKRKYRVSTVWIGIDHSMWVEDTPNPKPLIFETMVFSGRKDTWHKWPKDDKRRYYHKDYAQRRYSTEAQARRGHLELLNEFSARESEGK